MKRDQANSWWTALGYACASLLTSALILIAVYGIWFFEFHPEFEHVTQNGAKPFVYAGRQFRPAAVGGGGVIDNSVVITDFADDDAVVALKARFKARDYPFIKFNISGLTRYTKPFVFWRTAEDPSAIYQLPLNRSGDEVAQVAMVYGGDEYQGTITEIAIGFFDGPAKGFSNNDNVDIRIDSVELRPFNAANVIKQIYEDWFNPPLWQGYSNNVVKGIHENGMIFPNLVLNLLVATSACILLVMSLALKSRLPHMRSVSRSVLLVIGLCWAMGDVLRWQWRVEQLIDTHERYAGRPLEERIRNNPIRCARFPKDCRADLLPYF